MRRLVACMSALATSALLAGNLPLIQDGLVVHLDAADSSTMTLDAESRVREWRSKAGTVKFVQQDGQSYSNLPFFQSSVRVPAGANMPGVVFGFAPDYAYGSATDDKNNLLRTYLKADTSVVSKEIVMAVVFMNTSKPFQVKDINGVPILCNEAAFYRCGLSDLSDMIKLAGNTEGPHNIWSLWYYQSTGNSGGKAWVNGTLVCDPANGLGARSYVGWSDRLSVIDSLGDSPRTHEGVPSLGDSVTSGVSYYGCPCMIICEVAVYNRELTAAERTYVQGAFTAKWKDKTSAFVWTGAADGKSWQTAGNWSVGRVPQAGDAITIGAASVEVDGGAVCGQLTCVGTEITLLDGGSLAPSTIRCFGSGAALGGEGTLRTPPAASFSLPHDLAVADTLTLDVGGGGVFDLCGSSYAFVSVLGAGVITNSSLTAGTLAVGTSGDGRLDVPLAGNVDLLKLGKGTVSVAGWQKHTGRTVLEGGTLSAVTNLCVDAVNGLVLHFDASRPETMTLDADNRVRAWRAVNDPSLVLTNCCAGENVSEDMRQYMADCPIYRVTGIAGQKPAVEFGHTLSGALSPTILKLGETGRSENVFKIRHRTAMVVHYPDLTGQGSMTPYGRYYLGFAKSSYNYGLITSYPNASVAYGQSVWGMGTNEVYINARKVCDVVAGTVEEQYLYGVADPSLSTYGSPHVVTVAIPDITPALPEEEYRPIVGSSRFIPFNDGGSLTYTREYRGKICEILVFDRYLPDNERRMIETSLLHKWLMSYGKAVYNPGACRFEQSLSPFSSVEVTGDATLDFGGIAQSIPSLKLAAGAGRAYPTLTLAGAGSTFDLTGIDFDLSADNPVSERQTLLDGGSTHLTGPFKTEPMLSNGRIRYRATTVGYSTGGFTVLIR